MITIKMKYVPFYTVGFILLTWFQMAYFHDIDIVNHSTFFQTLKFSVIIFFFFLSTIGFWSGRKKESKLIVNVLSVFLKTSWITFFGIIGIGSFVDNISIFLGEGERVEVRGKVMKDVYSEGKGRQHVALIKDNEGYSFKVSIGAKSDKKIQKGDSVRVQLKKGVFETLYYNLEDQDHVLKKL